MPLPDGLVVIRLHNFGETLASGKRATGKEPVDRDWQRTVAPGTVVPAGCNWGYLPGPSGLLVLDVEPVGLVRFPRPVGVLVIDTPSGGYHLPMVLADGERAVGRELRRKIKLADNTAELHSFGSQVLGPGCRAWSDKAVPPREGVYVLTDDGPLYVPPESGGLLLPFRELLIERARKPAAPPAPAPNAGTRGSTRYGTGAFKRILAAIASASEGRRQDVFVAESAAAFELAYGGELDLIEIEAALRAAYAAALPDEMADMERRMAWARERGASKPRGAPARPVVVPERYPPDDVAHLDVQGSTGKPKVLTPGHFVTDQGEERRVDPDVFGHAVLAAMPPGALYRRARVPGELVGTPGCRIFQPLSVTRARVLAARHTELIAWRVVRAGQGESTYMEQFVPASEDHGKLVLAQAVDHASVRNLEWISPCPFYLPGAAMELAHPNWNDGYFYDPLPGLVVQPIMDAAEILAVLNDLVVDFPFDGTASKHNYFGLLLTAVVRPAIDGNVPMSMIDASVERSGKSKLAELVGRIILGEPTPSLQLDTSPEEQDKRIMSKLMRGATLTNLDNLSGDLDSAPLASLLTSTNYEGRRLGANEIASCPNRLIVIATANNVRTSSEIAKRCVPIMLRPRTQHPERRTDFMHPEPAEYAPLVRARVIGALVGAVELWKLAGMPPGRSGILGGFERWAAVVGGVAKVAGWSAWMGNVDAFTAGADDWTADFEAFVAEWWECFQTQQVEPVALLPIATRLGLFAWVLSKAPNARSAETAWGQRVMRRSVGRVVGTVKVERIGAGSTAKYQLQVL